MMWMYNMERVLLVISRLVELNSIIENSNDENEKEGARKEMEQIYKEYGTSEEIEEDFLTRI